MVWLEVLVILSASRTACLASDADTYKRNVNHDPWSEWTACSKSCGGGHKTRIQMCHRSTGSPYVCDTQKEPCQTHHCPTTAPIVGHWSEWSSCSVTCGNGESVRQWICSAPLQPIGKRACTPHSERQTCSPRSCPIDGHWGRWSEWSVCPVTCGGHSQSRHRECNNPTPSNGGRQCDGSNMENRQCPLSDCHVDGHWSGWSDFSKCTVSCGLGTQMRSRTCSNPAPRNGGHDCLGSSLDSIVCSLPACLPDGHWSEWSSCSVTCGNGESIRQWICSTQIPLIGKRSACTPHSERQTCSPRSCPIDGHWGSWLEWSMCPVTCVAHPQSRHRECNNPSPSFGGRHCEGSNMENRQCPLSACNVDGNWSGWSQFSKCTVSCGLGTQMRSRSCSSPAPINGGLDCVGSSMEAIVCSLPACVPEPRVCDKIRLLSSISHNNSISQNGDTSCTDPSYHSSRALIQELCNAPSTSLHFGSQVIDVCNQIPPFSPVVRKDDITGHTDYGILIECHGNQLKVASQDCNHYVNVANLDGTESDKYYVVNW